MKMFFPSSKTFIQPRLFLPDLTLIFKSLAIKRIIYDLGNIIFFNILLILISY